MISKEILLSFCIPTYNRSKFLINAIKAIQKLEREDIEIIILDNCSLDDTEERVLKLKNLDSRIKYYKNEKNIGQAKNIIMSFKKAKGKYIYLTSDEDELSYNFFSNNFIKELKEEKYSLIVGSIFDKNTGKYYIEEKENKKIFEKYYDVAFRHYLSGIIFEKNCLDLDRADKYTNEIGSDYSYVPLILMCIKNGNIKKSSQIICYKNQDKIQYTDNELKGIKAFYYQPTERVKQIKFYLKCIKEQKFDKNFENVLFKILARRYAEALIFNKLFLSYKEELEYFYEEISNLPEIGNIFKKDVKKMKIKKFIKSLLPPVIIRILKKFI